ncbi:ribonuclease P protein component [Patescibacteria group bacterium]
MLSVSRRLKKTDFSLFKKTKGKSIFSESFNLKIYETKPNLRTRFSVVVSSSVLKKVVDRNKLKRHVKGVISRSLKSFKNGFAVIIYLKKNTTEKELQIVFKKAHILK